jgi:predicted methyltransferase
MLRSIAAAAAVLALAACATAQKAAAPDPALQAAVAGAWRSDADRARDGARKPAEVLAFWGVGPGKTVIELSPGGGYWTDILAPYAKETGGKYIATAADLDNPNLSEAARRNRTAFEQRLAAKPEVYGGATLVNFGAQSGPLGPPGSADVVLTARNVHNWMAAGIFDRVLGQAFAVLKPGGVLAIEEHRANPGPQDPKAESGYVTEAFVIEAAERAGFRLDARSELLANPRDTKDHPFGVWTLPPVKQTAPRGQPANPAFDRTKYDAIGESDRMALRFVKPAG